MTKEHPPSLKKPEVFFLSMGGIGFLPKAPGTFASVATIAILYPFGNANIPFFLFVPFLVILTTISIYLINHIQKIYQVHDPSWIVIDEFLGVFVAWAFISDHHWVSYLIILVLFRFFDIVKRGPVGHIDKNMKNGLGIMLDDVVAGLFAGLVYLGISYLNILPKVA
ncbi:MAG: phosphatidylglycerophosphatase A [Epsilonproteobacteria bacterium]|nr:MAG: phosphatidylglycerophosphatase A [Campylobacterota bacterium]RLA67412.1 MAG: phosphatidylglycerophosphatase A [Campylobacterota bacterium]